MRKKRTTLSPTSARAKKTGKKVKTNERSSCCCEKAQLDASLKSESSSSSILSARERMTKRKKFAKRVCFTQLFVCDESERQKKNV